MFLKNHFKKLFSIIYISSVKNFKMLLKFVLAEWLACSIILRILFQNVTSELFPSIRYIFKDFVYILNDCHYCKSQVIKIHRANQSSANCLHLWNLEICISYLFNNADILYIFRLEGFEFISFSFTNLSKNWLILIFLKIFYCPLYVYLNVGSWKCMQLQLGPKEGMGFPWAS